MKSDNHNISEAYSNVNRDEIIEEIAPVGSLGQAARNIGARALKAVPFGLTADTGNKMQGQWEVGAETNRLYNMFMRDLGAAGRDQATGQDISSWLKNTAKFAAENPTVKNIDLKKSYPKNEIRTVFVNATKDQAAIFSGMSDVAARFGGNDQQTFASSIAVLTTKQRKQFVTILLQQGIMTPEELLSTTPLKQDKAAAAPAAPAAPAVSADQKKKDEKNARRRQLADERRARAHEVDLARASAGVSQSVDVGPGSSVASADATATGGAK